ncbi:hypothetical protein BCR44DRAFT_1441356, partial [Catenaria anguillulae PL171]
TPHVTPARPVAFNQHTATAMRDGHARPRQPMLALPVAPEGAINHAQNTLLGFGDQSANHIQASLTDTTSLLIDHSFGSVNDTIAVPVQDCIAQHAASIKAIAVREEHVLRTVDKACTTYAVERSRIVSELESLLAVLKRETAGAAEPDKVVDAIASDYAAQVEQLANAATVAAHGRLASFLPKR